jgi:hypothetical protein
MGEEQMKQALQLGENRQDQERKQRPRDSGTRTRVKDRQKGTRRHGPPRESSEEVVLHSLTNLQLAWLAQLTTLARINAGRERELMPPYLTETPREQDSGN